MRTSDFDYELPTDLIAQVPIEPRDASRLLVLRRDTGEIEHRRFTDILDYLRPDDLMVFNQSRVIPARLVGRRENTASRVELLLLRRESHRVWRALAKPARRLRPGQRINVTPPSGTPVQPDLVPELTVEVLEDHENGIKTVLLSSEHLSIDEAVQKAGRVPLPPYIQKTLDDPERYQTVYACHTGSAAAPTAGLHFTGELMDRIEGMGVVAAFVTLHVGLDTFRPVQGDDPEAHRIHREQYEISQATATELNAAKDGGRRIIAVGTTSVRVLEQAASAIGKGEAAAFQPEEGEAEIYILPGHRFRAVDAMLTNFHLPRSTLLMMVSAFAGQDRKPGAGKLSGRELVLRAYHEAMERGYRFYSFGDAMLVL